MLLVGDEGLEECPRCHVLEGGPAWRCPVCSATLLVWEVGAASSALPELRGHSGLVNTAAKGRRQEHRSMRLLESSGYRCLGAAGSFGEWDIVGLGASDMVLCQVRSRDFPGPLERRALAEWRPCPANTRKLLHRWRDRQRAPDVQEL